jgi:hypothetical protein
MTPAAFLALVAVGSLLPNERGSADSGLAVADAAYQAGMAERADSGKARPHFVRAAEHYEAAWDRGMRTPAVARNMAQARYLAGDRGRCIAAYRRGLSVFLHDPDLRNGLAFARGRVEYPLVGDLAEMARPRDPPSLLDRLPASPVRAAAVALALWAFGWFVLARAWITAHGGLALSGGALVLAAILIGGWLGWEDARNRVRWSEPAAVVLAPGTDLRTGNSDEYPKRFDGRLPAGVELRVLGQRGGWLQVELADGTVGWAPAGRLVRVEGPPPG